MPTTVKVIQAKDFVRANPEGHADMAKAEQLLKNIARAGAGLEDFHVLVDTRRSTALAQRNAIARACCAVPAAFGLKTRSCVLALRP